MENILTNVLKMGAINFVAWMEDNAWTAVWSDEMKKRAYVHALKGCSKTLDELWELFIVDERGRLETKKIK